MPRKNPIELVPVREKELEKKLGHEKVKLVDGQQVTVAQARALYREAKRTLESYMDTYLVNKELNEAGLTLRWELEQLKRVAEQDKDIKASLQALSLIRILREGVLAGIGPGATRMTAKESEKLMNIHVTEVTNILASIQAGMGVKEKHIMESKGEYKLKAPKRIEATVNE